MSQSLYRYLKNSTGKSTLFPMLFTVSFHRVRWFIDALNDGRTGLETVSLITLSSIHSPVTKKGIEGNIFTDSWWHFTSLSVYFSVSLSFLRHYHINHSSRVSLSVLYLVFLTKGKMNALSTLSFEPFKKDYQQYEYYQMMTFIQSVFPSFSCFFNSCRSWYPLLRL